MFNRNVNVTVETRMVNNDHFKIQRLMRSCMAKKTVFKMNCRLDGTIEITITTSKGCAKELAKQLNYLNALGIEGKIKR